MRTEDHIQPGDAQVFSRIVHARNAARAFSDKPVPRDILNKLVELTVRAPTSFNVQPWCMVLVTDRDTRMAVADGALSNNAGRVQAAPVVAVFAADTQAYKRLEDLQTLEAAAGKPPKYVEGLPVMAGAFTGTNVGPVDAARRAGSKLLSAVTTAPTLLESTAWGIKQTMCAATTFMYAAAAHGLSTAPMEGIDSRRIRNALNIPARYEVPVLVCLGYSEEGCARSPRFNAGDMVRENIFDTHWPHSNHTQHVEVE